MRRATAAPPAVSSPSCARSATLAVLAALALAACSSEPIAGDPRPPQTATGPNDFTRTGVLNCSAAVASHDAECPYGVSVGAGGTAVLHVLNPAAEPVGIQRILLYREGIWTTLDGEVVGARREGGVTYLSVDEREFYAVPDAAYSVG